MTLQEVRNILNDPNLSIEFDIECKNSNKNKKKDFNQINCFFNINTIANLETKKGTIIYLVTDDAIKQENFEDITDYFLNTKQIDKIRLQILEFIIEYYKYNQKKN